MTLRRSQQRGSERKLLSAVLRDGQGREHEVAEFRSSSELRPAEIREAVLVAVSRLGLAVSELDDARSALIWRVTPPNGGEDIAISTPRLDVVFGQLVEELHEVEFAVVDVPAPEATTSTVPKTVRSVREIASIAMQRHNADRLKRIAIDPALLYNLAVRKALISSGVASSVEEAAKLGPRDVPTYVDWVTIYEELEKELEAKARMEFDEFKAELVAQIIEQTRAIEAPIGRVAVLSELVRQLQDELFEAGRSARQEGATWKQLGEAIGGATPQSAQQRFDPATKARMAEAARRRSAAGSEALRRERENP